MPLSRQSAVLAEREVDMCFVRLPLTSPELPELHLVNLWEERPTAVVGTENVLSLHEELTLADLAEDPEIAPEHDDDAADRIAVVASGVGHARLPLSLARLHHRKDVVHREITDAESTHIALAWPTSEDDDVRQDFVATVRGRTPRSSR
ncbi:LysR family transcriptional regulator [Brachybacterium endophyticum]|uniref:LysR family transcriptional regulator n=1 Tax=Brachybacterium endophyticum TaxID=2182385 RepID=UPI001F0C1133|nr:LysR family transcriptional regulator [Brachybacterium endophyticum]